MRQLKPDKIPILPVTAIIAEESIAYGVGNEGIIIQFMDRDKCILIDWFDVVTFGIELLKEDSKPEAVEIAAPTEVNL